MKKVLFCTSGIVGGASRMAITISKLLPKESFNVQYAIIGKKIEEITNFFPQNTVFHFIKVFSSWQFLTFKLVRLIRKEQIDVIFSSLAAFNIRTILAAKVTGIKVIVRSDNNYSYFPFYIKLLMKMVYPLADIVVMQQEEMYDEFQTFIPRLCRNAVVLHNILDFTTIDDNLKVASPYTGDNEIRYVWMGRIQPTKGYDILLKAFKKVRETLPTAHLYLLGKIVENDKYYQSLQKYILDNSLSNYIHFEGLQTNPHRWIKHADCFVLPSRAEGLPNALIEAMYIGKPVVSTSCTPIISRIVNTGRNGYVVPVGDIDAMSDSMCKAIKLIDCETTYKPSLPEDYIKLFI